MYPLNLPIPIPKMALPAINMPVFWATANTTAPTVNTMLPIMIVSFRPKYSFKMPLTSAKIAAVPIFYLKCFIVDSCLKCFIVDGCLKCFIVDGCLNGITIYLLDTSSCLSNVTWMTLSCSLSVSQSNYAKNLKCKLWFYISGQNEMYMHIPL